MLVIISPQAKKQTQSTMGKVTLPDGTAQELLSVWQDTSHELWKVGSLNCQGREAGNPLEKTYYVEQILESADISLILL